MSHPIDTLDILHIYSAGPLLVGNWLAALTQCCTGPCIVIIMILDNDTQDSGPDNENYSTTTNTGLT